MSGDADVDVDRASREGGVLVMESAEGNGSWIVPL